jgi:penicillin-binding protein 2
VILGTGGSVFQKRLILIEVALGCLMAVLFGRLWFLQITRADFYREKAEQNRLRIIELPAPRGLIMDRQGELLVDNEISFSLVLRREYMKDRQQLLRVLKARFALDPEFVGRKLEEYRLVPTVFPIVLKNRLSFAEIAFTEAHFERFPELTLEWVPTRRYLMGSMASHLNGYVGEVTPAELRLVAFSSRRPGDIVGKTGLERHYNSILTGTKGQQKVFINSIGQITQVVDRIPAAKGHDISLSIDGRLQRVAEELLEGQKGALVAMDVRTGEIYCMVSKPEFDPNMFVGQLSPTVWRQLVEDPDKPMQNKAIQGAFAPGSIFKILVAAAAMAEGVIREDTQFFCAGETTMQGRLVHCWNASGHGAVSLLDAIANSCNIYFYNVGIRLGVDRIHHWAVRMGLGVKSGVDLPSERAGLIPSSEWKRRVYGQKWYSGETISVAIGQGAVSVTPIQVARFMSAVALNAEPPVPRLRLEPGETGRPGAGPLLPAETHQRIVQGMQMVVDSGTGTRARLEGISVAGKTGTAQLINTETAERLKNYATQFKENSWFACFAPVEDPRIAIAVIVEHGGHGGTMAAPIAGEVLRKYFELYPPPGGGQRAEASHGR